MSATTKMNTPVQTNKNANKRLISDPTTNGLDVRTKDVLKNSQTQIMQESKEVKENLQIFPAGKVSQNLIQTRITFPRSLQRRGLLTPSIDRQFQSVGIINAKSISQSSTDLEDNPDRNNSKSVVDKSLTTILPDNTTIQDANKSEKNVEKASDGKNVTLLGRIESLIDNKSGDSNKIHSKNSCLSKGSKIKPKPDSIKITNIDTNENKTPEKVS